MGRLFDQLITTPQEQSQFSVANRIEAWQKGDAALVAGDRHAPAEMLELTHVFIQLTVASTAVDLEPSVAPEHIGAPATVSPSDVILHANVGVHPPTLPATDLLPVGAIHKYPRQTRTMVHDLN
jgi:hypothetical protein